MSLKVNLNVEIYFEKLTSTLLKDLPKDSFSGEISAVEVDPGLSMA